MGRGARNITKKADLLENLKIAESLLADAKLACNHEHKTRLISLEREKIRLAEARIAEIDTLASCSSAKISALEDEVARRRKALVEYLNKPAVDKLQELVEKLAEYTKKYGPLDGE